MNKEKLLSIIGNTWIFTIKLIQAINAFLFHFYLSSTISFVVGGILSAINTNTKTFSIDQNTLGIIILILIGICIIYALFRAFTAFVGNFYKMRFLGGLFLTIASGVLVYKFGWPTLFMLPMYGGIAIIVIVILYIFSLFSGSGTAIFDEDGYLY
jgi:hypothetical protein